VVVTGLEGNVEVGAAGACLGAGERHGLGVRAAELGVPPFPDDLTVANVDGADQGVRRRPAPPAPRQEQRAAHPGRVRPARRGSEGVLPGRQKPTRMPTEP